MTKLLSCLFVLASCLVAGCGGRSHTDVVPVSFASGKASVGPFPAGITYSVHFRDSSGIVISHPFYQGNSAAPAVSLTVPPGAKEIEVYHRSSSNRDDNGFEYHDVK